jgi:hypothetical protein
MQGAASHCLPFAAAGSHIILLLVTWLESGFYFFCSCAKSNMKLLWHIFELRVSRPAVLVDFRTVRLVTYWVSSVNLK